ncbi:OmpW family outer membrane protein [Ponticaulis sp.]|uniref:OmpW/AlkL family protein n=1 Tax=Ponticaulis sp. TaxID=2020902 RepID=UPI000B6D73CD|nr:OmpW family outer membrane protein [Ponticaulis sp.]MAI91623.1 hypothetical protein [Ponticaulis sp.]OUX97190.1 MAG: hypothetical protein CBB65_14375 [Hyphomonadaceae bacterium TMED5]|tara:strand:- start:14370 stop:15032 length:663 start_codon:yes stop_codon:yes gene_type:complete
MSKFKYTLLALTTALMGTTAMADSPWQVRGRVLGVYPSESADLSVGGAPLGGDVDIDAGYVPELDITYFLTDNIAAELILGVTPHDVTATNVAAVAGADVDIGDVTLLPPTLTLQYHFFNETRFTPYAGVGLNYTVFFDEDAGPVADDIDYDDSFGLALQAGLDIDLDGEPGGWLLNVDVKKIWINSDVTVDFTTALGATVDADVDINPTVVGVGFGYRF